MKCLRVFNYVACVGLVTVARCGEWPGRGNYPAFSPFTKVRARVGQEKVCRHECSFSKISRKKGRSSSSEKRVGNRL